MRQITLLFIMFVSTTLVYSQQDLPTNSYDIVYAKNNPTLKYSYDDKTQTHNYSDNWDFDKDGKTDQLNFVGTGGAHLYFYLRVVLSSDNKTHDLNFIQSDNPVLPPDTETKKPDYVPEKTQTNFSVFISKDKNTCVFVKIDDSTFATEKSLLKSKGIKTKYIIIYFKNGQTYFADLDAK
ncbi:hypothetical protein [Flavobacterium filum]|uniref:hypothetical protein n=1 Tax=Flavobacterium filum TaxID=370974 RepID=UPI0023F4E408|nr:hypothetical protein [Flavobacterium filum]